MRTTQRKSIRRQASLYLSGVPEIEDLRLQFNPDQAKLIPAHVTLCREDEVDDWSVLHDRILAVYPIELTIDFGPPLREDNLVYLPAVGSTARFDQLRCELLAVGANRPRRHAPHITIIHPRNGVCTDIAFEQIAERLSRFAATFRQISLIEQEDDGPWKCFARVGPNEIRMTRK